MKKTLITIFSILGGIAIIIGGGFYLVKNAKAEAIQEMYQKTPEYKMELLSGHRAEASAIYSQHSGSVVNPIFGAIDKTGTGKISRETWDALYDYYTHVNASNEIKADLNSTSDKINTSVSK